jgi:hypothetical protein
LEIWNKIARLITRTNGEREALDQDDGIEAKPREEEGALGGLWLPHLLL